MSAHFWEMLGVIVAVLATFIAPMIQAINRQASRMALAEERITALQTGLNNEITAGHGQAQQLADLSRQLAVISAKLDLLLEQRGRGYEN